MRSLLVFMQIIRYSFFGLKETLGFAPSWLLWLRLVLFLLQAGHHLIKFRGNLLPFQKLDLKSELHSFVVALLICRYSTFMILYPTGILSEVGLIYIALPYIKVTRITKKEKKTPYYSFYNNLV
uniref:Very-long-chain (3R)-3-hydroxyacyl-CoA dehydratase n=1 Tax=Aegilops tauschii subsp. strangulata TaxID=200361 RepID=A0A453DZF6_AEGTS